MWYKNAEHFKSTCGYGVNGVWYPRVTKILEIKSKPGLDSFFKEVGDYSSAENIKNKSAEEGSLVHGIVEKLVSGESPVIPEEIKPAILAFEKLREERGILFHPEFVEKLIWSERWKYAGTVDVLATIDGKFGVLDVKTSGGFWPEYNLQTAAYLSALQEIDTKRALTLPREIRTRWILRIDQKKTCKKCGASRREKGGRVKIRERRPNGAASCSADEHQWGGLEGEAELREFPYFFNDLKAFIAAKTLWEWENGYWLKQIGYL